jgi:hypothetical protein
MFFRDAHILPKLQLTHCNTADVTGGKLIVNRDVNAVNPLVAFDIEDFYTSFLRLMAKNTREDTDVTYTYTYVSFHYRLTG